MTIINMKKKLIQYFDSMGTPNDRVLDTLEDYLKQEETIYKTRKESIPSSWKKENVQGIPQQTNESESGIFACMFAEHISRGKRIAFKQNHMKSLRKRIVYEIYKGKLII